MSAEDTAATVSEAASEKDDAYYLRQFLEIGAKDGMSRRDVLRRLAPHKVFEFLKTEAASEKRKRGRPRLNAAFEAIDVFGEQKTRRGRQEAAYAQLAAQALAGVEGIDWCRARPSVMAEIGRAVDRFGRELCLDLVRDVEAARPKTVKDAVRTVRQWRNPESTAGTVDGLVNVLVRTLNEYVASRAMSRDEMLEAIAVVQLACRATGEEESEAASDNEAAAE